MKTKATGAKTGVVLVNWNSEALTRECVSSLLSGVVPPDVILVVDNGSEPPLSSNGMDHVQLIRSERNLGFTGANNLAIRRLLGQAMDFIWVLNNDTVVDRYCLRELLKSFEDTPDQSVAVPKILYHDAPDRIWYAGGHLSRWRMTGIHRDMGKRDRGVDRASQRVTFVTGCSILVRRQDLVNTRLFREGYFAYYEDVEWSLRASAAGLVMGYVPTARVYHRVSAVLRSNLTGPGRFPPLHHFLALRNRCYTIRLHAKGAEKIGALAWLFLVFAWLSTGLAAKGRLNKLRAALAGMRDGLWGPLPELPETESGA